MTFLWPSNSKWLPPEQNFSVFIYINYNIIEKYFFFKKFEKIGDATDLLTKHLKLGLIILHSNLLLCAPHLEWRHDFICKYAMAMTASLDFNIKSRSGDYNLTSDMSASVPKS